MVFSGVLYPFLDGLNLNDVFIQLNGLKSFIVIIDTCCRCVGVFRVSYVLDRGSCLC